MPALPSASITSRSVSASAGWLASNLTASFSSRGAAAGAGVCARPQRALDVAHHGAQLRAHVRLDAAARTQVLMHPGEQFPQALLAHLPLGAAERQAGG